MNPMRLEHSLLNAILFAFVVLLSCGLSGVAQTNTFPTTGNAGAGTTTPADPLDVSINQNSAATVVGINNSSGGVSAQAVLSFFEGSTQKLKFAVNSSGASSLVGGANAFQIWNFMNSPIVFGTNSAERMRIDSNGNVGIGTTTPGNYRLSVNGSLYGVATYTSYVADGLFGATAVPARINTYNSNGGILFGYEDLGLGDYSPRIGFQQTYDATGSPYITSTKASIGLVRNGNITVKGGPSNTEFFRIDNSGNVGIGTSSPNYKLDVNGSINAAGSFQSLNTASTTIGFRDGDENYRPHSFWVGNTNANGGMFAGLTNYPGANSAVVNDGIFLVPAYLSNWNQWVPTLSIRGTSANGPGNVGIGITSPGYKLDVQGGQINSSGGFCIAGDCKTAWSQIGGGGSSQWSGTNPGPIYYTGGNVGIGTASPASNLQIGTQTAGSTATPSSLSLGGSFSNSAGSNLKLKLYDDGVAGNTYGIGVSSASMDFAVHASAGYHWYAGGVNKMTLNNNGDLTVSGNIAAKYQDVAEWVPSSEKLAGGTVVVLDSIRSNQVIASRQSYDTRVAGVVSEQPGIALGEKGDGKVMVATTGRVRVKADASKGAINIGDLLVTSDIPGVAMKSEPVNLGGVQIHRPGTLIGKALEPLAKGSGTILVLLSLQ